MNYYLVDYENVNVSGFQGIKKLDSNDIVIIFYSDKADTLTFGLHRRINESSATFEFQKVSAGIKNALDFQLCSYLGFLIRDNLGNKEISEVKEEYNYYIVSNDRGYAVLPDYWKTRKVSVELVANVAREPVKVIDSAPSSSINQQKESTNSDLGDKLCAILSDVADVPVVLKIINHYKTKQGINTALTKNFVSQKAGEIYRTIKPLIADRKGQ